MKVLITYGRRPPYPPHGEHLAKAFRNLGHTAVLLGVRDHPWWAKWRKRLLGKKYWKWDAVEWANRQVFKTVEGYRPDMLIETEADLLTTATLRTIKRRWGTQLGLSLVEGPFRGEPPPVLREYDRIVSTSRVAVEQLRQVGFPHVEYLPFATDPTWFHPRRRESSRLFHPLGFIGAYAPRRAKFLEAVSDLGLSIWGPDWDRRCTASALQRVVRNTRGVFGRSLVHCYQTTQVVLNIQREHMMTRTFVGQEIGTGLGWRHFDVPACGSALLTEWIFELSEAFDVGREVETFSSPEELREKACYLLSHESYRRAMIRRARERVLREHTYRHRAQKWAVWFNQLPKQIR